MRKRILYLITISTPPRKKYFDETEMLTNTYDRATVTDINRNIAATLKHCGPALIADPTTLKPVAETLLMIMNKKHSCQLDFGDTEDMEDLEESSEYDWLIIDTALDTIIGLSISLGETFGQLWKIFEKTIMKFASSSETYERSTSIGVIAECIQGMKGEVTPFTTSLLKLLLHRMSDEDPETKSNAAFAIGLLQEHSKNDQEILASYNSILAKLEPLLHTNEARAKDNAAGCVSRMIMKHRDRVPIEAVLPALLELLPLKEDFEENEPVYKMILQLCTCQFCFVLFLCDFQTLICCSRLHGRTHNCESHFGAHPGLSPGTGPSRGSDQGLHSRAAGATCSICPREATGAGSKV